MKCRMCGMTSRGPLCVDCVTPYRYFEKHPELGMDKRKFIDDVREMRVHLRREAGTWVRMDTAVAAYVILLKESEK